MALILLKNGIYSATKTRRKDWYQ